MLSRVGDHILQEFYTMYVTRFRAYKIAYSPQDKKSRRGGGLKQITSGPKVLMQVTFKTKKFCIAVYESYLYASKYDFRMQTYPLIF